MTCPFGARLTFRLISRRLVGWVFPIVSFCETAWKFLLTLQSLGLSVCWETCLHVFLTWQNKKTLLALLMMSFSHVTSNGVTLEMSQSQVRQVKQFRAFSTKTSHLIAAVGHNLVQSSVNVGVLVGLFRYWMVEGLQDYFLPPESYNEPNGRRSKHIFLPKPHHTLQGFFQYFLTPHPWTNGTLAAFDHLEEVNHRNNKRNTSAFFGLGAFVNQRLPIYVILLLQVFGTKLFFGLKTKLSKFFNSFNQNFDRMPCSWMVSSWNGILNPNVSCIFGGGIPFSHDPYNGPSIQITLA